MKNFSLKINKTLRSLYCVGALMAASTAAHSAVVFVEDNGSTLELTGRIQPEVGTMFTRDSDSQFINGEDNGVMTRVLGTLGIKFRKYINEDMSAIGMASWHANTERNDYQTDPEIPTSGYQEGWNVRYAYAGLDFGKDLGKVTFGRNRLGVYKAMRTTDRFTAQNLRTVAYNNYITRYDDAFWWNRTDGSIQYNYKNLGLDLVVDYVSGNGQSSRLDHGYGILASYKIKLDNGWSIKPIYSYSYWDGSDSVAPRGYRYDGFSIPLSAQEGSLGSVYFNQYANYDDYSQHILAVQVRNDNYYLGVSYINQKHNLIPDNYRVSSASFAGSNYGQGPSNINSSGGVTSERCTEAYTGSSTSLSTVWSCATGRSFTGYEAVVMYKLHALPKLTLKVRKTLTEQDVEVERQALNDAYDVTWNDALAFEAEYKANRALKFYASYRNESFYQGTDLESDVTQNDTTWVTGFRYDY